MRDDAKGAATGWPIPRYFQQPAASIEDAAGQLRDLFVELGVHDLARGTIEPLNVNERLSDGAALVGILERSGLRSLARVLSAALLVGTDEALGIEDIARVRTASRLFFTLVGVLRRRRRELGERVTQGVEADYAGSQLQAVMLNAVERQLCLDSSGVMQQESPLRMLADAGLLERDELFELAHASIGFSRPTSPPSSERAAAGVFASIAERMTRVAAAHRTRRA
ncbi:MAG: hypothetical protein AAF658_04130 [Myxococcota bacterium]